MHTDILIVGSGAAGLFCSLQLPSDKKILIITKKESTDSDSFLAQGGICVLKSEEDYDSYSSKIKEAEAKRTDYEDIWYKKFSSMETALAKMQSNSSAVASLLGGS